jgi:ParB family chromosome partitioning protein
MGSIGHYERIRALAATPRWFITAGVTARSSSEVIATVRASGKRQWAFEVPSHVHGLAAWHEESLFCACADGSLRAHRLADAKPVFSVQAHVGGAWAVALSPDGTLVATVGADGRARLAKASDGAERGAFSLSAGALRAVAMDPAGELLAAAGDDGVVYVVTLATGAIRALSGHSGPVLALRFTPRDGRLASGGQDGTVRLWYVTGDADPEVRGADDSGHVGGVTDLQFVRTLDDPEPGVTITERFVTVGMDGRARVWALENRRKPRTIELSSQPLHAVALVPPRSKDRDNASDPESGHGLLLGGDDRVVSFVGTLLDGTVEDRASAYTDAFESLATQLQGQPAVREAAIRRLATLEEEEARPLLIGALSSDREPSLRALCARLLGEGARRFARAALKERLDDGAVPVREAALAALRAIDGESALAPLRFALASRFPEPKVAAIRALAGLHASTPLAEPLIVERLADSSEPVRKAAFDALCELYPEGSPAPLAIVFDRGAEDVVLASLLRAAQAGLVSAPGFSAVFARALDDPRNASVRRTAFALRVAERPALLKAISGGDEDLRRTLDELARAVAARARESSVAEGARAKAFSKEELEAARATFVPQAPKGAKPDERDREPLLAAMACRTPETALRGARGLAALGDARALGALLQLSREGDATLRKQAAAALKVLEDPRAKRRLTWMFDDADGGVRAAALEAYATLEAPGESAKDGAPSLDVAESALRSTHEDVRVRGLDRLVKVGAEVAGRTPHAESLLGDALEDEAEKVRAEAFRTLWAWHEGDPRPALDRALAGRFADLRARAVTELSARRAEPWALERLLASIADRDESVAKAAFDAALEATRKSDPDPYARAMESVLPSLRALGAQGAKEAADGATALRASLTRLLQDEHGAVRIAAVEALDALVKDEAGPLYAALQSSFYDLRVRAAELLAKRGDERILEPMRALVLDKELPARFAKGLVDHWRARAAQALATLGSRRALTLFAAELLKDELAEVREAAARGLSLCSRRGDEGFLLDALSHADVAVRSWAADGLARLGDTRALPVLIGNLRHASLPIRVGAVLSFAALGAEGDGGLIQGLDDPDRAVQERVFAIILARDLDAYRRGAPPELLSSALSSQRPDVRFAAARALELRSDPEAYLSHLIEVLLPPRPEKAADAKGWPSETDRARAMVGLANALASEAPEQRYAAAQALNLRSKPLEYFAAARAAATLRSISNPWVINNALPAPSDGDATPEKGWLRRLFSGAGSPADGAAPEGRGARPREGRAAAKEDAALMRLAFGAYIGLLRQAGADEEAHRTRRDAIDRIVTLSGQEGCGEAAALAAVVRALDDEHHMVRRGALAGLKKLLAHEPDRALAIALEARSPDVARAALDELAARGPESSAQIARALDAPSPEVRKHAFEWLEKLAPKGSLDPLIAALASAHADLRLGVIERLATSVDPRVDEALRRALGSEHDDLRLRAAELLARKKDPRTADVLGAFLRHDDDAIVERAGDALVLLRPEDGVPVLAGWMDERAVESRAAAIALLGRAQGVLAIDQLATQFDVDHEGVRREAFLAALQVAGAERDRRDDALAMRLLPLAARSRHPSMRKLAVDELDAPGARAADEVLRGLFGDRDPEVRVAAVRRYARRVIEKGASVDPLREVLKTGARELVLGAAEGVAHAGDVLALRPLLLVVRAGLPDERPLALLALGTLGDARALAELELYAGGGTEEFPAPASMQCAAIEGLGRLHPKLTDPEARRRVFERLEQTLLDGAEDDRRAAAARGMRYVGGERARGMLEQSLAYDWQPDDVRAECASLLADLADPASEPALARALHDDAWEVRDAARRALDKLFAGDKSRVAFLGLDSPHEDIADEAVRLLANEGEPARLIPRLATLGSRSMREALRDGIERRGALPLDPAIAVLSGPDTVGRTLVARLAGALASSLDPAAKASLGAALRAAIETSVTRFQGGVDREGEEAAWREALWASRRLGDPGSIVSARAALEAGATRAPASVRREAVLLSASLAGHAARPELERALSDADDAVRRAALDALRALDAPRAATLAGASPAIDPITLGRVAQDPAARAELLRDRRTRLAALPAAIACGDVDALIALATDSSNASEREEACRALGRAGGAKAREALALVAKDNKGASVALRKAAYSALKRAVRVDKRATRYATTESSTSTEAAR